MITARGNVEQAPSFPPVARFAPVITGPNPWHQAHELLREIEDHRGPRPENTPDSEARLRLVVERIPALLKELRQAHEELAGRVALQTAELSLAVAGLKKQLSERGHAERRLAAEHAVARILTESIQLIDAAPKILQAISQNLKWDVGALWILDREAEVLRCIDVWHAAPVAIPAFEQASRQRTFLMGIGLPGRVWASGSPCWIPDLARDANSPLAPFAAQDELHAAVGFPIRNGSEFLGVMEFFSREIGQPDKELLGMMTSIGSHISQFMERMKAEKALLLKETELGVARKIQQGLVAKAPPLLAGFEIAGESH
jgi:transcriptional regulator with GAF, ATPase, and Fis domain